MAKHSNVNKDRASVILVAVIASAIIGIVVFSYLRDEGIIGSRPARIPVVEPTAQQQVID